MDANGQPDPTRRSLSTTVPFGFDFDTPSFLAAYRELGCTTAQFYRNPNLPPTTSDALRTIEAAGMRFDSIHGLFGADIDPSSPDRSHRDSCVRLYESEGRLALDLGVSAVVVHPSGNRADYQPYDPGQARALEASRWPYFDDFALRLADVGDAIGVTYLIENVTHVFPLGHNPAALAARLLSLRRDRLRMCFDTGHAHVTDDVTRSLLACAPAIDYLHIHDNDSTEDNHRMPGDGTIDWRRFAETLQATNLCVPCMLEVFYPVDRVQALAGNGLGARLAQACATIQR